MNSFHKPVLLKEALEFLNVQKDGLYIDATLGGGGHTEEILKKGGKVLGIDIDQDAVNFVRAKKIEIEGHERLKLVRGNYKDIDKIAHLNSFDNIDGVIFDLGVSSFQIDTPDRGFSYQKDGPLDMRMDKNLSVKAADLINILTKGELNELFNKLGEEYSARIISERIISARRIKKIETVNDLIKAVEGNIDITAFHRAKRFKKIFQALRIAVNDELNNLREALPRAIEILRKNGRVVVISFHSLEDRIVKNAFEDAMKKGRGIIITKKPIKPEFHETELNRRSKSSMLRVFEKI